MNDFENPIELDSSGPTERRRSSSSSSGLSTIIATILGGISAAILVWFLKDRLPTQEAPKPGSQKSAVENPQTDPADN